jgi:p-hydroxybenzoate 3-monooxygenase
MLSHLLHLEGVESVVLEKHSRDYVTHRVRAGVLEQGTVDLLRDAGLGARVGREGLVHHGIELRFDGRAHRIAMSELTGRTITIYPQQKVVEDLIDARLDAGGDVRFEVDGVAIGGLDDARAAEIRFTHQGGIGTLTCDYVAGCDGFHGVCRHAMPSRALHVYERGYPFCWLGVLADVPPSTKELIYAHHARGFALHSLRSPALSRLYLQCDPEDEVGDWPDDRIWSELHQRFATGDGWTLREGPILDRTITAMRALVVEPMQHGRLFLAGDAAHIVPPTGAKGLNLAMSDVRLLARALARACRTGDSGALAEYSAARLRHVWQVQQFSSWMTSMLHRFPDDAGGFQHRLQLGLLTYVCESRSAQTSLAENYVGLGAGE